MSTRCLAAPFPRAALLALALAVAPIPAFAAAPVVAGETLEHEGFATVAAVLANDYDPDGEALTLSLVGTTCSSAVDVSLDLITLGPTGDWQCTVTYKVTDESGSARQEVLTVKLLALFKDGFESGNTNAWDSACSNCGGEQPASAPGRSGRSLR